MLKYCQLRICCQRSPSHVLKESPFSWSWENIRSKTQLSNGWSYFHLVSEKNRWSLSIFKGIRESRNSSLGRPCPNLLYLTDERNIWSDSNYPGVNTTNSWVPLRNPYCMIVEVCNSPEIVTHIYKTIYSSMYSWDKLHIGIKLNYYCHNSQRTQLVAG